MRFLVLFLALFSLNAFADSPLIWSSGTLGKFLSTRGFLLNDGKEYTSQSASPITTPHAAPIGSIVTASIAGVGHFYLKTSIADNGWTDLNVGGSYLPLTGGSLSGSLGMTSNYITGVLDPVNVLDAANKQYVDNAAADSGIFAKLLGRSGGQTLNGGTAASNNLILNSTTNATHGNVLIGGQSSEKVAIGSLGTTAVTLNNPIHAVFPSSNSDTNGFVIQANGINWPNLRTGIGPQGFQFIPKDIGGTPSLIVRADSDVSQLLMYRSSDGTALGSASWGLPWGFTNANAGIVTFKVSGTTGQAVDIAEFSNQSGYSNIVSSIGSNGQMRAPAGTAALPGQSFHGITGDGMRDIASGSLGWSTSGVHRMALTSTGLGVGVTNPTAMLDVGGGARIQGLTVAGPVTTDATGSLASAATLPASMLPNPSATTLGGVQSIAKVASKFLDSISTSGVPSASQPNFTDIAGGVANAQLPTPQATSLGGVKSIAHVATQFVSSIGTDGGPVLAQPNFTDIAGGVSNAQLPTPQSGSLGGIKSLAAVAANFIRSIGTDGTPVASQPNFTDIAGGVSNAQLPTPQTGSLGGVKAINAVASNFLTSISSTGTPTLAQVNFTDILGGVSNAQLPTPQSTSLGGVKSSLATTNFFLTGLNTNGGLTSAQPTFSNISGSLGFSQGGTNAITAAEALLNLLPSQSSGSSGKYLQSNFPNPPTWTTPAGGGSSSYLNVWSGTTTYTSVAARIAAPSAGSCSVTQEYGGDWINGTPSSSGTGACTITANAGCSTALVCICTDSDAQSVYCETNDPTSTSVPMITRNIANIATNTIIDVQCYCPK